MDGDSIHARLSPKRHVSGDNKRFAIAKQWQPSSKSGEIATVSEYIGGEEQRQGDHLQSFGLSPEPQNIGNRSGRQLCCWKSMDFYAPSQPWGLQSTPAASETLLQR
jgi:hypothetical protein